MRSTHPHSRILNWRRATATVSLAVLVAASGAATQASAGPPKTPGSERCASFAGRTLDGDRIGLPGMLRGDVVIDTAVHHEAAAAVLTPDLSPATVAGRSSAVVTPAKPAFCQLTGRIGHVTDGAQDIGFQINLPDAWNRGYAQFGGAGFNGALTDATGYIDGSEGDGDTATPLMRGYVTVGTDSGHLVENSPRAKSDDPVDRANALYDFALNDEMFENFATNSYKLVYDTANIVSGDYYGASAEKHLWFGTSEGGREGVLMAQRYPTDFDGIFVRNPVIGWTGLFHNFIRTTQALEQSGTFSTDDIRLAAQTSSRTCDAQDGIEDGIVADYWSCQSAIVPALRTQECTGQAQPGTCFTPEQVRTLEAIFTPTELPFELPSGASSYPAFLPGGEWATLDSKIGATPGAAYGEETYPFAARFGIGAAAFVFSQDPDLAIADYRAEDHADRVREVSALMDTLDPDLRAFADHGGKLIVLESTNDYAQSGEMGMEYYESVVREMGLRETSEFLRLYVSAGTDHSVGSTIDPTKLADGLTPWGAPTSAGTAWGVPYAADWVTITEQWANGTAVPGVSVTATARDWRPPYEVRASVPQCHYPLHPRYVGGDPAQAESYRCG